MKTNTEAPTVVQEPVAANDNQELAKVIEFPKDRWEGRETVAAQPRLGDEVRMVSEKTGKELRLVFTGKGEANVTEAEDSALYPVGIREISGEIAEGVALQIGDEEFTPEKLWHNKAAA